MDQKNEALLHEKPALKPPTESRISTVLNGIGNGMMVGAIPLVIMETAAHVTGKQMPHKNIIAAFATVTGCGIGTWFGLKESNRMQDYRLAINNEIGKIRDEVKENSTTIREWSNKLQMQTATSVPAADKTR